MSATEHVEIYAFTDPVCTWCWGSEPVTRKLDALYGQQIEIKPVMGGLVEDIRGFYDAHNNIGGNPEQSNAQIASHWLAASERHGMPVETQGFRLFSSDVFSTYPQNIAYKAVEITHPELAEKFLRRIREASAAEARETGRREVLIELASETGVGIASFIEALDDGSAEAAFHDDLNFTRQYGVRGFPTFLFRYGEKELLLRGYQSYKSMVAVIASLSAGNITEVPLTFSDEKVVELLKKITRAANAELTEIFNVPLTRLLETLNSLVNKGIVQYVPVGNGGFWQLQTSAGECDPLTGTCSV